MDKTKIKEMSDLLLNSKQNREGIVMIPSVNGFDVYKIPGYVLKVFVYSQGEHVSKCESIEREPSVCHHDWMYISDFQDGKVYQCCKCNRGEWLPNC